MYIWMGVRMSRAFIANVTAYAVQTCPWSGEDECACITAHRHGYREWWNTSPPRTLDPTAQTNYVFGFQIKLSYYMWIFKC